MPVYRLSEASSLLGVSDDTLRRWGEQGRFSPARTPGGSAGVDGVELAALATSTAHLPERGGGPRTTSARNRMRGIVTAVTKDTVMAQVEMCCGPYRVVSLMSRRLPTTSPSSPACWPSPLSRRPPSWSSCRHEARAALAAALVLSACSGSAASDGTDAEQAVLRVLAAASLTEAFTELESVYEDTYPDIDVQTSYDSSAVLAQQVLEGAPADVLATADEATMARVTDEGLAEPQPFATNTLTLVTPARRPWRRRGHHRPGLRRGVLRGVRTRRAVRTGSPAAARRWPVWTPRRPPSRRTSSRCSPRSPAVRSTLVWCT
jgi:hypothetical protein